MAIVRVEISDVYKAANFVMHMHIYKVANFVDFVLLE